MPNDKPSKAEPSSPLDVGEGYVEDGFGSVWPPCEKHDRPLQVMRPGDARCPDCETESYIDRLLQEKEDATSSLAALEQRTGELVTFKRDPNNGAGLWAVFVGEMPIHHFRPTQDVSEYMARLKEQIAQRKMRYPMGEFAKRIAAEKRAETAERALAAAERERDGYHMALEEEQDVKASIAADRDRLREMLRTVQWKLGVCPICGQSQEGGHAEDCALAALLGEEGKGELNGSARPD